MTKDELLAILEHGRKIDEALLLYSEHIKNTLYLSGFDRKLRNKTKEILNVLHRESYEHKIFMRQLIDQVKEEIKMLTEKIYRQYFIEIHHKQREMIILLRNGLGKISDDRIQKALSWHMKREIRLAVLIQKLVRCLSSDANTRKEQLSHPEQFDLGQIHVEQGEGII